jgi:ribosomal protein S18 acetylase RimI-like enzyme
MRRLEVPPNKDVFERGSRSVVRSFEISREEVQRLQRERPELVAAEEAGVMLLEPRGSRALLHYGFASVDALRRDFRRLLEGLAGSLRKDEAASGIFLWLVDLPNRSYVEPVLRECLFELRHEWMDMTLAELPDEALPPEEVAPGFILRDSVPAELEAMAAIGQAAFGDDAAPQADFVDRARRLAAMRVLEERASGRLVGHVGLSLERAQVGKVSLLAVHPDFQRRGLSEAMMRWSLVWLRRQGMRRARLTVLSDNAHAIAIYRKLGFAHERSGLTYRRPTDKRALAAMAQERRGTYVRFGDWR